MTEDERDRQVAETIKAGDCPFGMRKKGDPFPCIRGLPGCGCGDEIMLNPYLQEEGEMIEDLKPTTAEERASRQFMSRGRDREFENRLIRDIDRRDEEIAQISEERDIAKSNALAINGFWKSSIENETRLESDLDRAREDLRRQEKELGEFRDLLADMDCYDADGIRTLLKSQSDQIDRLIDAGMRSEASPAESTAKEP